MKIPFLRPHLVELDSYRTALEQMQASRLYSNFGPLNTEFESRLVRELFAGQGAATTVTNATLGLMLAINVCRRRGASLAIMPSFTFAATPLAAQWCGLKPYFLDVAPDTWCLAPREVERVVEELGDRVAVVVACATFGAAIDLEPYQSLIRRGIPVIVDAAPGLGVRSNGQPWGLGFEGPIVYSLHATKTFAVGEGGVVYSSSAPLIASIREASSYGFHGSRESVQLGLNAKMSEFAAAVALATLTEFPAKAARRAQLVETYMSYLNERRWSTRGWATQNAGDPLPRQFFPILAPPACRNSLLIEAAARSGVQVQCYFSPTCHQQAQFAACPHGSLVFSEALSQRILSLPLWEEMQPAHIATVLDVLEAAEGSDTRAAAARSGA